MRHTYLPSLIMAILVTVAVSAQEPEDIPWPEELMPLKSMMSDQTAALEKLREFDRAQSSLADWDLGLAERHKQEGDMAAMATKQEDAKRRIATVERGYQEFLKAYPDNSCAVVYYGELLYDWSHDEVKAVDMWKRAESLDPKIAIAFNNLGIHYCHAGQYDEGFHYFEKALEVEPDNPDFLFNVVNVYLTNFPQAMARYKWTIADLYKDAMRMSARATELSPKDFSLAKDYGTNFFWATTHQGLEADWPKAAKAWQAARALSPNTEETFLAWLNEGRVWLHANDKEQAKACLLEAQKIHPDSEAVAKLLSKANGEGE